MPDALARIARRLPELLGASAPEGTSLWCFLPGSEALAAAGLAPDTVPDPALLDRSAVASTLVAALELAREGRLTLAQEESFGDVRVSVSPGAAIAKRDDRCAEAGERGPAVTGAQGGL